MLKKTLLLTSCTIVLFVLLSASIDKSSSGAPASHTGAPDEKTCTTAGCHDDHEINSGTAHLNLEFGENVTHLIPGKTYSIKIQIHDKDVKRFGFQLLALGDKSKQNAGRFEITDSHRTQILKNRKTLTDREYVTYTFNGTDAVSPGLGEWMVNWTAPENLKEKVTFYFAAVSGNDDMGDKGDYTFTQQVTFKTKKH